MEGFLHNAAIFVYPHQIGSDQPCLAMYAIGLGIERDRLQELL
jgi:hypothetical protein